MDTDETYKDRNGERQKRTEWHRKVAWGKKAEFVQQYLKKGSLIYVEGSLRSSEWQDKEGRKRTKVEIIASEFRFIGEKREGAAAAGASGSAGGAARSGEDLDQAGHAAEALGGGGGAPAGPEISDEDIPF